MKVIFVKNLPGTADMGDIKEVSDGYARNFLIKKGYAKPATADSINKIQASEKKQQREAKKELEQSQKRAGKLEGVEIVITTKVSDGGTLYSAIGAKKICEEVKKAVGVILKPNQIELEKSIKELGEYEVKTRFPHGLEAEFRVRVEEQ